MSTTPAQGKAVTPETPLPQIPVWGMALTPFHKGAAAIDHESLRRHVSSMVDDGVSGLVALGVIAEPSALSREERADALDAIIEAAGDRPVVATAMTSDPDQRAAELRGIIAPRSSRLAGLMLPRVLARPPSRCVGVHRRA